MKSISTINPVIMENVEYSVIKARVPDIDKKRGCVARSLCFTVLCFQLLQKL